MEDFIVPVECTELKYEWFKQSDIDRFCSHIITPNWQDNPDICWETNYAKNIQGYSVFWLNGKNQRCNRVAYSLANKCNIPSDKFVLHLCNNPKCINPKHLELGTNQENMDYKLLCGRTCKGEDNGGGWYTEQYIWDLLVRIYNNEFKSMNDIQYHDIISSTSVSKILNGTLWKDLTTKFCHQYNVSLSDLKFKCYNPSPHLSDNIVREIRSYPNSISHYAIGKIYGVSRGNIRNIRLFITHKDVK